MESIGKENQRSVNVVSSQIKALRNAFNTLADIVVYELNLNK